MNAFERAIQIAADNVDKLRSQDVYRVLESCPRVTRRETKAVQYSPSVDELARYIAGARPDLYQSVVEALEEIKDTTLSGRELARLL